MEVEMLGRIAEIYGLYLDDKEQALHYAKKGAAINPGQLSLRSAFHAAGIEYDTSQYKNRFEDVVDEYDTPQKPIGKLLAEMTEGVGVSPNPFNPSTTISYSIAENGPVKLTVYNMSGQKIATLVDTPMTAGTHQAVFDGSHLASGIYFYRIDTKRYSSNGKMMLVK